MTKIYGLGESAVHQLFLEPEGRDTNEVYLNGFSTSLPADLQRELLNAIPGFENVSLIRPGYAIEYGFVDPRELRRTMASSRIKGLFLAGQINGTTGYEEAGAQGILAGINAARRAGGQEPVTLGRADAYIGVMADYLSHMHQSSATMLSVDVPSGLMADTGEYLGPAAPVPNGPRHPLSLLTLKPGLFTAAGRDQAGTVWLDTLGATARYCPAPAALLLGATDARTGRAHAAHKGSQGDVVVIGGQSLAPSGVGMTGAAILAARAALHAGAGRVYVGLLAHESQPLSWDPQCPELMFRRTDTLLADEPLLQNATVVCGCGTWTRDA